MAAIHLPVPAVARPHHVPLAGHGGYTVHVLPLPHELAPPAQRDHDAVTRHLLRAGRCPACGQPLHSPSRHLMTDWADCLQGHIVDLGPARAALQRGRR